MSEIVLDAFALIAMLKGEKGTDIVAAAIAVARISTINYAEVITHFIHLGMPEREVDAMLDPLPMTIVPTDKALAQLAGRSRALSVGDRFCLARAQRDGLPAWTSNQSSTAIADAVQTKIVAIRRKAGAGQGGRRSIRPLRRSLRTCPDADLSTQH